MTVAFIMLDGVRPDALLQVNAPRIRNVMETGAVTLNASSLMPTMTLPCHISLFHSVPPARHGITSNVYTPFARPLTGLVEQAALYNRKCAFFYNWEQLRDVARPGTLAYSYFIQAARDFATGDQRIADAAAAYISTQRPDFVFVYFGTVDEIGHDHGWMSDPYLRQIEHIDGAVGQVIDALPADSALLMQADHGGHDRTHGTDCVEDVRIPWLLWGASIRQGYTIQTNVTLLDTTPTLAKMLSIPSAETWEGRVIDEAFIPTP